MSGLPDIEHHYPSELVRKGIHFCSLSIPIVYSFIEASTALAILVPLTLAFGLTDLARTFLPSFRRLYHTWFGWLLRPHEKNDRQKRLNGATYVLLSATLSVLIFPKVIVITAFAILIVSDSFAALVGRKIGKRPFLKKSLAGAIAFFASAVAVVAVAPKVSNDPAEYAIGVVAALVGTIVESMSISIDDNISIPFSVGAAMWVMYAAFLPAVNVAALNTIR
jgi:dolichol kinase